MRSLPVLLVLTALLAAGCSVGLLAPAEPSPPASYPHHTAAQILGAMEAVAARDSLVAFQSQARLEIRSPGQTMDATATLRQRGADTLWASVRGPLNLEVARALFTADSAFVHDRLRNRLLVGPVSAAQALFPGPVGLEEVLRTLTGTLRPDPSVHWIVNAAAVDGAPAYWLTAPDGRTRMAVHAASWRVLRYERLAPSHGVLDARRFEAFEGVEGRVLPHRIVLSDPSEGLEVTVEHRRLALNPGALAFPFSPGTATRMPFGSEPVELGAFRQD
jgi:hypothetical protein